MKANNQSEQPKRATISSCGYDFALPYDVVFKPNVWVEIDTGVRFDGREKFLPKTERWFMLVAPRSGLGMKYGMRFANTVGIIDQDYRDNIMARVTVDKEVHLNKGERFMQGVFLPYLLLTNESTPTEERAGGLGSTDKKGEEE